MKRKKATYYTATLTGHSLTLEGFLPNWTIRQSMKDVEGAKRPDNYPLLPDGRTIPRGMSQMALRTLRQHRMDYHLVDLRPEVVPYGFKFLGKPDYRAGIILGEDCATMDGLDDETRTRLALEMVTLRHSPKTLIAVLSKARLEHWKEAIRKYVDIPEQHVGQIAGHWKHHKEEAFTIAAVGALMKYDPDFPSCVQLVIDQVHKWDPFDLWELLKVPCRFSLGIAGDGKYRRGALGTLEAVAGPAVFDLGG